MRKTRAMEFAEELIEKKMLPGQELRQKKSKIMKSQEYSTTSNKGLLARVRDKKERKVVTLIIPEQKLLVTHEEFMTILKATKETKLQLEMKNIPYERIDIDDRH